MTANCMSPMKKILKPYPAYKNSNLPALRTRQPTAWHGQTSLNAGYEINFNRYFYKPKALRTLEEIRADLLAVKKETEGLLDKLFGGETR